MDWVRAPRDMRCPEDMHLGCWLKRGPLPIVRIMASDGTGVATGANEPSSNLIGSYGSVPDLTGSESTLDYLRRIRR